MQTRENKDGGTGHYVLILLFLYVSIHVVSGSFAAQPTTTAWLTFRHIVVGR
jgi:hypothetical protein